MYAILFVLLTAPAAPTHSWWTTADPDVIRCYAADTLAGEYTISTDTYRPWCGALGRCVMVPNSQPPAPPPSRNFGVFHPGDLARPRVTIAGQDATLSEALSAIPGPLPERSGMDWLVYVGGTPQQRKEMAAKIPADVRSRYRESFKNADQWQMRPGYKAGDPVRLYWLAPGGRERHVQADGDVPAALIEDLRRGELREKEPGYDPAKSPDRRKMWGSWKVPAPVGAAGVVLAGCALASTFARRKPKSKGE